VSTGARAASTSLLAVRASALEEHRVLPADPRDDGGARARGLRPADRRAEVAIVHPEKRPPVGTGEIGEIWVASPSMRLGYWGREEESAAVFRATIAGGNGRAFLRTGDLGFLRDGEVFVTDG
jgi:acyl-CoA synthetase (AMP-forming)/AMP-acid ligase II